MKRAYHEFKRILPHSDPDDPPWIVKALCKPGTTETTIRLVEHHVEKAIELRGFADGNNCAGGICLLQHRKAFGHPVMPLVDWWYNRVYVCEGINRKTNKATCRVYAHYDGVAELFDGGPNGLQKLLNRVRKHGHIDITLYPVRRGKNPKTGKDTNPSGPSGPGGTSRSARHIGTELRVLTHARAFSDVKPTA